MICFVVGARPNFVKMAPIVLEFKKKRMPYYFVHTGQHYDRLMSGIFFDELGMPKPHLSLGVGSGPHGSQVALILQAFEKFCMKVSPSMVVVAGDVNSTLACALAAVKLGIPVAHVESGLRSFDLSMPEEHNRKLTDHLASVLFATEPSAIKNLSNEGVSSKKIYYVGNTMIDSLKIHLRRALAKKPWNQFNVLPKTYGVVTLHRPSNVDDVASLKKISTILKKIQKLSPVIFPVHPRTLKNIQRYKLDFSGIKLVDPLGYLDFLGLMACARYVLTDSGGIQEETTALGVPCLTMRSNTERPVTITHGTNRLVKKDEKVILKSVQKIFNEKSAKNKAPKFWDGKAASRIARVLMRLEKSRRK